MKLIMYGYKEPFTDFRIIWLTVAASIALSILTSRNRKFDWDAPVRGNNDDSLQSTFAVVIAVGAVLGTIFMAIFKGITHNKGVDEKVNAFREEGKALTNDLLHLLITFP
jgi:hypothetical protein